MNQPPQPALPSGAGPQWTGPLLALLIVSAWWVSLLFLLLGTPTAGVPALVAVAEALRTFLQTGLFIVGHDAMHGSLLPSHPRVNEWLGRWMLANYALLPYGAVLRQHRLHHHQPVGPADPDGPGHGGERGEDAGTAALRWPGAMRWYLRFMGQYLSLRQMLLLLGAWGLAIVVLQPLQPSIAAHLLLFWTLPLLLSSLQLFLFGTYLPHRGTAVTRDRHRAISLDAPVWLSLLCCYHFGYHWEHHAFPGEPWFRLPERRRRRWRQAELAAGGASVHPVRLPAVGKSGR